jgi:hypothetical protein
VTDKDHSRWPSFKTKEAAQEIAARCHAIERQTIVHWRVVNMENGSWLVAAYKDGWIQPPREDGSAVSAPAALYDEIAQSN